jgi:capsular exopolysaccharide synthesis family protein
MNEAPAADSISQIHPRGQDDVTIFDHLAVAWSRKGLLFASILVFLVLGTVYTFRRRTVYSAETMLVVETKPANGGITSGLGGDPLATLQALTQATSAETQVAILASPALLSQAFASLGEEERLVGFGPFKTPREAANPPPWAVKIDNTKDTEVISIDVNAQEPKVAADFANAIANQYLKDDYNRSVATARQARKFVETQLKRTEQHFEDASRQLADFEHSQGLVDPDAQLKILTDGIGQTKNSLDISAANLAGAVRSMEDAKVRLAQEPGEVPVSQTTGQNPEYAAAQAQLIQLQTQLALLLQEYAPDSKTVLEQLHKIDSVKKLLASLSSDYVSGKIVGRNPSVDDIKKSILANGQLASTYSASLISQGRTLRQHLNELKQFPALWRQYTILNQHVEALKASYAALAQKEADVIVAENSVLPNGFIASQARVPNTPSSPNHIVDIAFSLFVGCVFGLFAIFLAERSDPRLGDPYLAAREYGLEALASIPELGRRNGGILLANGIEEDRAFSESIRYLRNRVLLSISKDNPSIISITSPGPGEGKTTTAVNLAASFGREGKRVLLVDANFQNPALHQLTGGANEKGFTTAAKNPDEVTRAISKNTLPNVDILTTGPTSGEPDQFLNLRTIGALFGKFSQAYDMVIVDCPPCVGVAETQVLGLHSNGVILVTAANKSLKEEFASSVKLLRQVDVSILGVVDNRASKGSAI